MVGERAGRIPDMIRQAAQDAGTDSQDDDSRATSPGVGTHSSGSDDENIDRVGRTRPRVFPYTKYLPYETETPTQRERDVDEMIRHLYICVASGDFVRGAVHWTKEIRGWMSLKFDLTKQQRITLIKLYYELALAPGLDYSVAERFASMFMVLTKRKHYLRPGKDLYLDWRPIYKELKVFVLPQESSTQNTYSSKRNVRTLTKLCTFAQIFFDPREIPAMMEEFLPYYTMSFSEQAFVVLGLFNLMLPTSAPPSDDERLQPQYYLPTFFHLWSTVNRSMMVDMKFLDIFSRLARDCLSAENVRFGPYGLFTEEQSALVFTSILRLLEIPVGQATTPYSGAVDLSAGSAILIDRDARKHPVAHHIARWIIMSLSPSCLENGNEKSILHQLEALIEAVETFAHPSNSGAWTKPLSQLVYYLADFFVMRWNREQSGEYEVPPERRLNEDVKRRFVLSLRDVVFMGIYAKSSTAMNFNLSTLSSLAFLEPTLVLPGALQRIYPAMQGLVEVHRTVSSIRALQMLSRTIARTKGFRCHLTTLLGLALPGIDANDLDKTMHSLSFIQAVCYNIPLYDLTKVAEQNKGSQRSNGDFDMDDEDRPSSSRVQGTALALEWISAQVARFDQEGPEVLIDYENELTDEDEEMILQSSTAGLSEFITSLLARVFTLLQNLPDAARVKSGSPEENVINTLPATFSPLLASLSPDLYDIALEHVARFATSHVVHQARDAMAFICNALVKISPRKALQRLLPELISSIRTEITENGAGSTRTTGSEILPRDRALVWHVSLLSMCVVHVGADVLAFQDELFEIADFMQAHCKGIPLVHVSNYIHHLLLNLTVTHTVDYRLYDVQEGTTGTKQASGVVSSRLWGQIPDPAAIDIEWHVPCADELTFAIKIYETHGRRALDALVELTSESSTLRDGVGKEWSDEVARYLHLLRLVISGMSRLFRSDDETVSPQKPQRGAQADDSDDDVDMDEEDSSSDGHVPELTHSAEDELKRAFYYPTGYPLEVGSQQYKAIHALRKAAGETLHRVHDYLVKHQEDDVPCFQALYTAYRSWFVDLGIERSAHVLDRLTRLLAADIHPFKFSGTRKQYPRPLLVRRANLYHFQRLRFNEHERAASDLDRTMLLDLAHSCTSSYTDIRRTAQSAVEQAIKSIAGSKTLIIPPLMDALDTALRANDHPRIKGALYSLLFGSLGKPIGRNWNFAPRAIKLFIQVADADRPSIQKMVTQAIFTIQDMTKASDRMVILDEDTLRAIWPQGQSQQDGQGRASVAPALADTERLIAPKRATIKNRRAFVERRKAALAAELLEIVKKSQWKQASRTAMMAIGLDYRFETIASDGLIELVVTGIIDPHPTLRTLYSTSMNAIFSLVQTRALTGHTYENYLLDAQRDPDEVSVPTERDDPDFTERFLESFAQPKTAAYIDGDYPGWLVWQKSIRGFRTGPSRLEYDEVEMRVRRKMGSYIDRHWLSTFFGFMKQEPRDANSDRFRMSHSMIVAYCLDLMAYGLTPVTFEDFKDLTLAVYGDGSDKHQHRAMAEILGAMLSSSDDVAVELREQIWEFAFPIVRKIISDGLTPENSGYWATFVSLVIGGKDPRRAWPLVEWLSGFRLDMQTNAAFKESSQITLLQLLVGSLGWHFQLDKPIVKDMLTHLDHPYKGVREVMGTTLATIFRTRYHESYRDIPTLLETQRRAGPLGTRPYEPTAGFAGLVKNVLAWLEKWRLERPPGIQTPTPYTQASKTVLLWLDTCLSNYDCTSLVPFFPTGLMSQLLHMMDIKEDPELQSLAYHVFRHLPNIPHRGAEAAAFVAELVRIGRDATSWHQRLRVLINIQVLYFRNLFLMPAEQAEALFACVREMLRDPQLEVRLGAATTLSGMIRCSPVELREKKILEFKKFFTTLLVKNPLPPKTKSGLNGAVQRSTAGTPTPEQNKLTLTRHAAVLGLGALVQAFPYTSPPPPWLPEILATLAGRAASDPGTVGQSVKTALSDFKKTRQDTWHVDVKAFKPEQLEDLEGVLWKSYFA